MDDLPPVPKDFPGFDLDEDVPRFYIDNYLAVANMGFLENE
jgi:hypothetical protein